MKKILLAAAAAAALSTVAAPAFAQVNGSVVVTATVDKACGLTGTLNSGNIPVVLPISSDGRLNGTTGGFQENNLLTADQMFGDVNVWCNAPANVTVTGEPLQLPGARIMPENVQNPDLPIGFTDNVPLTLRTSSTELFTVAGYEFQTDLNTGAGLDNATKSQTMNIPSAFSGELVGNLKFWGAEQRRLIAGTYTATWTISIAPAG